MRFSAYFFFFFWLRQPSHIQNTARVVVGKRRTRIKKEKQIKSFENLCEEPLAMTGHKCLTLLLYEHFISKYFQGTQNGHAVAKMKCKRQSNSNKKKFKNFSIQEIQ